MLKHENKCCLLSEVDTQDSTGQVVLFFSWTSVSQKNDVQKLSLSLTIIFQSCFQYHPENRRDKPPVIVCSNKLF